MANVIPFRRRPRPTAGRLAPMDQLAVRAEIEEAAQAALDTVDHLLAILDGMDGDTDAEVGADAEPALAAPENHHGSQVVWMRGNDADREAEALEVALPVVAAERTAVAFPPLPWGGRGNILAAAGVLFLDMVAGGER